ncbi:MAG: lytic transglycosylase domain-containing protein [Candidatus Eremiobacteraeota bacterium]|nr:lytic transglycosylase domain-containing protein [Candidatus Eremiobacteraeota bacterium]
MSMDFESDILRVQSRIAEIFGVPAEADPAGSAGNLGPGHGRFSAMVNQALAGNAATGGQETAQAALPPEHIEQLVQSNASAWQVDPALVRAIMANESAFDPNATSKVGAQGLMQLMPETAASLGVTNSYDPEQNVWGGTRYLRSLLDRFGGDLTKAVAAYNAGPGAVEKYGGVPPYSETQAYVKNVLDSYQQYKGQP